MTSKKIALRSSSGRESSEVLILPVAMADVRTWPCAGARQESSFECG